MAEPKKILKRSAWIMVLLFFVFLTPAHAQARTIRMYVGQTKTVSACKGGRSKNTKVATVSKKGKIVAKKTGTTKIITKGKTIKIQVCRKGKTLRLSKNKKLKLSGKCVSVENENIIKICKNTSKIKALKKGKTYIYVKEGSETVCHKVTIGKPYFEKSTYFITYGSGMKIPVKGTNSDVKWDYDEEYLYREAGKFYAYNDYSYGMTKITAKTGKYQCSCTAYIGNIIPEFLVVKTGETVKLYNKNAEALIDFDFKIADTSIATVTKTGHVTGKKAGVTTLSITVQGKTYTCDIQVSDTSEYHIYIDTLEDYKPYISENLYDAAVSYGLTYTVMDVLSEYSGDPYGVNGYIDITKHKICIKTGVSGDSSIHEMGHFLNHLTGTPCYTSEFQAIYEEEGLGTSNYWSDHALSNLSEYFAESYMKYILYPTHFKTKCPKTYAFVKKTAEGITDADLKALMEKYPLS